MLLKRLLPLMLSLLFLGAPAQSWAAGSWAMDESAIITSAALGATTTSMATSLNVATGSTLVLCFKWEFNTTVPTIVSMVGTGTNTFTLLTAQNHTGNQPDVQCGYFLAATANATYNVTTTFSNANATFVRAALLELTHTGTASADGEIGMTEGDSTGDPTTSAITASSAYDSVCVAIHGDFATQAFSGRKIGGVAADGNVDPGSADASIWWTLFVGATTNGMVSTIHRTTDTTKAWIQRLQCFKTDNAAPGGGSDVKNTMTLRSN